MGRMNESIGSLARGHGRDPSCVVFGLRISDEMRSLTLAVGLCLTFMAVSPAHALVFVVNSTGDRADSNAGNADCETGFLVEVSPGVMEQECTLRAAIEESNVIATDDEIVFASTLPLVANTVTISPATGLPTITDDLVVNGYNAPGPSMTGPESTPVIQLNGASATGAKGLRVVIEDFESVTIQGIAIYDFDGDGINAELREHASLVVQGSHLGLSRGSFMRGNRDRGLRLTVFHQFIPRGAVTIGQSCDAGTSNCTGIANVFAANDSHGIEVHSSTSGTPIAIHGNRIGTDRNGNTLFVAFGGATPNGGWGIFSPVGNTEIGGNLVSGNALGGISIGGSGQRLYGNSIGTNLAGNGALPNEGPGIDALGSLHTIGFAAEPNLVSGNLGDGIAIAGIVTVAHNTIGLTRDQSTRLGNGGAGVLAIGSGAFIRDNVIGGEWGPGISLQGSQHTVRGNLIGTNATGADLGNSDPGTGFGILVDGSNIAVGNGLSQPNVVGFYGFGIFLSVSAADSLVSGNYVGTNSEGADLGNTEAGIVAWTQSFRNRIGAVDGRANGLANTVGFNGVGVFLGSQSTENIVLGNYIGTDALGRDLGNQGPGIRVTNALDSFIGSSNPGAAVSAIEAYANEIAYNAGDGVELRPGFPTQVADRISIVGNVFRDNSGLPIDLGANGTSPNDPFDADSGVPNQGLNTPEFDVAQTEIDLVTGELNVRYRVDAATVYASYPLTINFYYELGGATGAPTEIYLGSDVYPSFAARQFVEASLPFPNGQPVTGRVVATTSDAGTWPRTSELSAAVSTVPEPGFAVLLWVGVAGIAAWPSAVRRPA